MSGPLPVVTYLLGAWDLSICGDLLLQGVIFAQTAHYFALYDSDLAPLRLFVLGLLLLTTLKSMQMIAVLWVQNVVHFTDIRAAGMMYTTNWLQQINLGFGAFIAFYIQLFMCQRLWALCKNVYILLVLLAMFTFSLVAAFVAVGLTFNDQPIVRSTWISLHFGIVFGGDLLLCGSMAYYLLKHSKQVLPQTAGMLNAVLRITVQSAMPGAVCAMITLINSQIGEQSNALKPSTMVTIISSNFLPKLYALSAMWTLNSRRAILLARSTGQNTSSNEGQSGGRKTGVPASGGHGLGVELGDFGKVKQIQVRTQVQTTHHIDPEEAISVREHGLKSTEEDTEVGSTKSSLR
ncbi:hypothetical protein MIND_00091600 [Mycena indigotica]|uniref:DUF6534 domain-containing protein n=1 Tax=Mycena indigotica TaxID=2126181 RepID=A0A8H6TFE5_9AGAR|nr:uncharacterized protein MIND_00091600 [Mycena indigotica]KAF7315757.1 hypothetical protein MIND_00091600 [Mycena indigotica]